MAIIPKPQFPNVPNLPGVPQIVRSPQFPAAPPVLVSAAIAVGRLFQALLSTPQWGIFRHVKPTPASSPDELDEVVIVAKRRPAIVPDNFMSFDYRNEFSVSDYPVQDGNFASYNKVANPFENFVRMTKGGTKQERKAFLDAIDSICASLDTFDILTPERTFLNVNPFRFTLTREGNQGAYYFAEADLYFREIREVTATYTTTSIATQNAKLPSALPVTNVGVVYGQQTSIAPSALNIPAGVP